MSQKEKKKKKNRKKKKKGGGRRREEIKQMACGALRFAIFFLENLW